MISYGELVPDNVVLERLKVGLTQRVSAEFAQSVQVESWLDHVTHQWVYAMTARVLAERLPPETVSETSTLTVEVPGSPWQQFKATHADSWWLRWLVRWRPVRLVEHHFVGELTVRLDRFWTYPQSRISTPELGQAFRVATWDRQANWADESEAP